MESPEALPLSENLYEEVLEAIPDALELAELTGEQIPIEPSTLGILGGKTTIEELDNADKGSLGRALWRYFELPTGNELKKVVVNESTQEIVTGKVPGTTRERVYKTNTNNTKLHELLFSDGQKRFTVSFDVDND